VDLAVLVMWAMLEMGHFVKVSRDRATCFAIDVLFHDYDYVFLLLLFFLVAFFS
jgi:hypothetical protein